MKDKELKLDEIKVSESPGGGLGMSCAGEREVKRV